jgi:Na+-driven multidrug efflux pump
MTGTVEITITVTGTGIGTGIGIATGTGAMTGMSVVDGKEHGLSRLLKR